MIEIFKEKGEILILKLKWGKRKVFFLIFRFWNVRGEGESSYYLRNWSLNENVYRVDWGKDLYGEEWFGSFWFFGVFEVNGDYVLILMVSKVDYSGVIMSVGIILGIWGFVRSL